MIDISKIRDSLVFLSFIFIVAACQSQVEKIEVSPVNKFTDSVIVQIYDLVDKRDTKGLLQYFNDPNPTYRKEAALAMGSVQDSLAIPMLANLLNDEYPMVRRAAAYALGQTYDSAAIEPLTQLIYSEDTTFVKKEALEALGKVITQPQLSLLNTYLGSTTDEKEGLAWGLYRAGTRNVHDQLSVETAISFLTNSNSHDARLGAAHFLYRTRNLFLDDFEEDLIKAARYDSSPEVRMAVVSALRKINGPMIEKTLVDALSLDQDYRVKINAIRSLSVFEFSHFKDSIYNALNDENVNVAITAASLIASKETDDTNITEKLDGIANWRVKATLYGAANKLNPDVIRGFIVKEYQKSTNPYYRAELLSALSTDLKSHEFIITETFKADHAAVSTAGILALVQLRSDNDFPEKLKPAFADIFSRAIETGDVAIIALVSEILRNPDLDFKSAYENFSFLVNAKDKLSLPKDNETLQSLNKTIAYFEGSNELPETKNEYNNPIDWDSAKRIKPEQKLKITTEKGDVVLKMLVEQAPGSVINFIKLSSSGYFNGKNFHRVVPNFVIQVGCNRGDGFGSEDYSIRSEFANLRYETGSVGMASAGKDTEGTQWFITHSPTPHLDGGYTIFAEVYEGMDIVHRIEMGDKILNVELID